jgi:hypothetical protein
MLKSLDKIKRTSIHTDFIGENNHKKNLTELLPDGTNGTGG